METTSTPAAQWRGPAAELKEAVKFCRRTLLDRSCREDGRIISVQITPDQLTLGTTDLRAYTRARCVGECSGASQTTMRFDDLRTLIRDMRGDITLIVAPEELTFDAGGRIITTVTNPMDPLPQAPQPPASCPWYPLPGLPDLLKHVSAGARGEDDPRPELTNILVTTADLVTTDTHRLHIWPHGIDLPDVWPQCLIPRIHTRWLTGEDEIAIDQDGHTWIRNSRGILALQAWESRRFPGYARVIPKDYSWQWTVDAAALHDTIRFLAPIARRSGCRTYLSSDGNQLNVRAMSAGLGVGSAALSLQSSTADVTIAINCDYLMDTISSIAAEGLIRIRGNNPLDPLMFDVETDEPSGFVVLMPMQQN